ncbi:MAG: hypothetical protein IKY91_04815 [Akkermansia sp.]|nr:hypothetical protein [Akkermansia sp.]
MKYIPKPYQQFCIDRLLSPDKPKSAGLFLDMGLGPRQNEHHSHRHRSTD